MANLADTRSSRQEVLTGPIELPCGRGSVSVSEMSTTSKFKLKEYSAAGLHLDPLSLEVAEMQPTEDMNKHTANGDFEYVARTVAAEKAEAAFYKVNRPVLVEDTSLFLCAPKLRVLAGPLIKQWTYASPELQKNALDILTLAATLENDRRAEAYCVLAVSNGRETNTWVGKVTGMISDNPRGGSNFGWDCIFMPEAASQRVDFDQPSIRTWAEMSFEEKINIFPFRGKAVDELRKSVL